MYILGTPLKPTPHVSYDNNGRNLILNWDEPFTHPGFSVTNYTVTICDVITHEVLFEDSFDQHLYIDNVTVLPTMCNERKYIVTAFNDIGNSTASVVTGFPISECVLKSRMPQIMPTNKLASV